MPFRQSISGTPHRIRLISNHGVENDTLERLITDLGLLEKNAIAAEFIKVTGPLRNLEALERNEADLCVLSGLNPLGQIAAGSPMRIIGSAMKPAALSMFAKSPDIRHVSDLKGRRIGVGPRHYLLHMSTIALLRRHGIDESDVRFVEVGSNAQVLRAIVAGEVDAGPSSVATYDHPLRVGVHRLAGGNMWSELPDYTNQIIYTSQRAISDQRVAIVQTLASFAALFGFLQSPHSWEAFVAARSTSAREGDRLEAASVWRFLQEQKPYGETLEISPARLRYMQDLHASLGVIEAPLPVERVADMSMARDALRLLD
jgi:ABC-type nitrate/sulfonate/bicarbonate transport system substrate-binding protein